MSANRDIEGPKAEGGTIATPSHWMRDSVVDVRISSSEALAFLCTWTDPSGWVGGGTICNCNPLSQIKPRTVLAHATGRALHLALREGIPVRPERLPSPGLDEPLKGLFIRVFRKTVKISSQKNTKTCSTNQELTNLSFIP